MQASDIQSIAGRWGMQWLAGTDDEILDEGEVFVVKSIDNVPDSMWLRAALKGLTIMTELAFETLAQKGALMKLKGYLAMHKYWFISDAVRLKHPGFSSTVEKAFCSATCKSKLVPSSSLKSHLRRAKGRGTKGTENIWIIEKNERHEYQGLRNVFPRSKILNAIKQFDSTKCLVGIGNAVGIDAEQKW